MGVKGLTILSLPAPLPLWGPWMCLPQYTNITLTHTLNLTFLYETVSTLKPTVGIVVTDCPSLSLYKIAGKMLRIGILYQ